MTSDVYILGGHYEAGYVTHGTKVPRERHSGNGGGGFTPSRCLKGRPSYDKPLCDAITAALEAGYPGDLEAAFTDFTDILFSQDSVRLYSERGYFECIATGGADGARQCRSGTRGNDQAEEWFQLSIRAANSLWDEDLGLKSLASSRSASPARTRAAPTRRSGSATTRRSRWRWKRSPSPSPWI